MDGYHAVKHLVLIGGFAGSGKTELGKLLAVQSGWTLLDKDTLTRPLVEELASEFCGDPDDRQSSNYLQTIRPLEYRALLDTSEEVLTHGSSVIMTAPFLREVGDPDFQDRVLGLASRTGAQLHPVWVVADTDTMMDRLISRGASRDRWKLGNWDAYLDSIDVTLRPTFSHDVVDNGASAALALGEAVDLLLHRWGVRR